ncbi:hypothetical protein BC833DRAFT_609760 [Globomyces pollinis-pini]|nr:hypothetical protein BC833DRAFT_609760 [Globomyces pollinis-pini]
MSYQNIPVYHFDGVAYCEAYILGMSLSRMNELELENSYLKEEMAKQTASFSELVIAYRNLQEDIEKKTAATMKSNQEYGNEIEHLTKLLLCSSTAHSPTYGEFSKATAEDATKFEFLLKTVLNATAFIQFYALQLMILMATSFSSIWIGLDWQGLIYFIESSLTAIRECDLPLCLSLVDLLKLLLKCLKSSKDTNVNNMLGDVCSYLLPKIWQALECCQNELLHEYYIKLMLVIVSSLPEKHMLLDCFALSLMDSMTSTYNELMTSATKKHLYLMELIEACLLTGTYPENHVVRTVQWITALMKVHDEIPVRDNYIKALELLAEIHPSIVAPLIDQINEANDKVLPGVKDDEFEDFLTANLRMFHYLKKNLTDVQIDDFHETFWYHIDRMDDQNKGKYENDLRHACEVSNEEGKNNGIGW